MQDPMEEANWPQSFDMEHFKALTSFKARMDYCQAHLARIGGGTGRMVYQIDDQTVIKLAKNAKGVAQNKAEDNGYIRQTYDHIVTNVLDRHPDHLWIESELAKKITRNRFKQLSGGVSIDDVGMWMRNYEQRRNGNSPFFGLDVDVEEAISNNEFFSDIANMANEMNMRYGDFGSLSSYGEFNGELRLVDYGLSSDVYTTHYARKPKAYSYAYESVVDRVTNRILSEVADQDKAIRNANFKFMGAFSAYINTEVPKFFLQEAGIETVLHFLAQEDGMNIRMQWANDAQPNKHADFSKSQEPTSDDEFERILQRNKVPYSLAEVKQRLVTYFIRRLAYNTPRIDCSIMEAQSRSSRPTNNSSCTST